MKKTTDRWRRRGAALLALGIGVSGLSALATSPAAAAASTLAAEVPAGQEAGITRRTYDLGYGLKELCELKKPQTPNVDNLMPTIDWTTTDDFGLGNNFVTEAIANLNIDTAGTYGFELTSDDGSELLINSSKVVDNDGLHGEEAKSGTVDLTTGMHTLLINHFDAGGGKILRLKWKKPGDTSFAAIPSGVLTVESGQTRVTSPGAKVCVGGADSPGDGLALNKVNPNYDLVDLRPAGFEPRVSALEWLGNDLLVGTWGGVNSNGEDVTFRGELYKLSGVKTATSPADVTKSLLADKLNEPMGMKVVDGAIYISEKHQLTKLVDTNGNGTFDDNATERVKVASWPWGKNFHEFAFGLVYKDGFFYVNLSVAINYGGATSDPQPGCVGEYAGQPCRRGSTLKINKDSGAIEYIAGGLRTPNGIGLGPDDGIFVTDNQGSWLPASKLIEIKPGRFFNHYNSPAGEFDNEPVTKPVLWMPHNEIANSPTTPVLIPDGPFQGQMWISDITYGGIQRAFLEKVEGEYQGALFRMTQGLEAGVHRLLLGDDGTIIAGGLGADGNWGQNGKLKYGLQKLDLKDAANTFEMKSMKVIEGGFEVEYTQPLSDAALTDLATKYKMKQWGYRATSQYGGPKLNEQDLTVTSATASTDRKTVSLKVDGLKPDRVVYLRSPRPFDSQSGETLWSTEAWYTLNTLPGYVAPEPISDLYEFEDGILTGGAKIDTEHPGFSGSGYAAGMQLEGFSAKLNVTAAKAGNHVLEIGYANGPHPFQGTKKVSLYVNGTKQQISLPSTGSWPSYKAVSFEVDLQAGANTIEVRYDAGDDGNVNLDYAKLTHEDGDQYEAEDAILGGGAKTDTEHAGFTGSGYVSGYESAGTSTTFRISTHRTGDYPIRLRYANGPHPQPNLTKKLEVYVNGSKVSELSLPPTGEWKDWGYVDAVLSLEAGENDISFRMASNADDSGHVNLDHLRVKASPTLSCEGTISPNDEFDGTKLDRCRWTAVLNEDSSGYSVADGKLSIKAPPGDIIGNTFSAKNVIVQPAPADGSWTATTKVSVEGNDEYLQAGLVIHSGNNNHGKVVVMRTPDGSWVAELGRTTDGQADYKSLPLPADLNKAVWLRMTMSDGFLKGAYSVDGIDWTPIEAEYATTNLDNPSVGLAAYNGSGSEVATFESFTFGEPPVEPETCAPVTPDAGYKMLFDGTRASLEDWKMAGPGGFPRRPECTILSSGGMGLLWHKDALSEKYSLKLDWKMVGDDNSGVFVGFPDPGNDPWVAVNKGHEIQIDATDNPTHTTGAIYGFSAADAVARDEVLKPPGQWNSYELLVEDQRIRIYLNGTLINDYTDVDPARMNAPSFIGLQNHGNGDDVFFRNIQVKDFNAPVVKSDSTVTLTLDKTTYKVGEKAIVLVKVSRADGSVPTGTVTLSANGGPATSYTLVNGSAAYEIGPFDSAGTVELLAAYGGDDKTKGSQAKVTATVEPKPGNNPPTNPPGTNQPPVEPAPVLKLLKKKVKVKGGKATVPMRCLGTGKCAATALVKKGKTKLARGKVTLAGGRSGTAKLNLTKQGKALFTSKSKVRAVIKVKMASGQTLKWKVTLKR